MKTDKTDKIVENHIGEAIVRKGEQGAIDELKQIDSSDELRLILGRAEMKHSRVLQLRTGTSSRRLIAIISAAAVVAAAVLIVGFQPRYSTAQLYEQWNETPIYEPRVSRGDQEIDSTQKAMFDLAGILFESGDMSQALSLYEQASAVAPNRISDAALFYWAAALAHAGKTDDAIVKFSQLAADSTSEYSQDAAWQLSIAYLHIGNRKKAIAELVRIATSDSFFADRAHRLLAKIRRKIIF